MSSNAERNEKFLQSLKRSSRGCSKEPSSQNVLGFAGNLKKGRGVGSSLYPGEEPFEIS